MDPISLLMSQPESFVERFNNSPFTDSPASGVGNSSYIGGSFKSTDDKQAEMMVKLMENMLKLSERMLEMMGEDK